jgi:hypothetical protein
VEGLVEVAVPGAIQSHPDRLAAGGRDRGGAAQHGGGGIGPAAAGMGPGIQHGGGHFCDPRSPWQRGTNENTNGLLRQYLSKGGDLRQFDQTALDAIAAELNGRPRQTLGFKTPSQALAEALR